MLEEQQKQEESKKRDRSIPFLTLLMTGAAAYIYFEGWQKWNYARARRTFVFSETNFFNNRNYACLFLQPISFESEFFFYANIAPMVYSSILVERHLGVYFWLGAYLLNCVTSAVS